MARDLPLFHSSAADTRRQQRAICAQEETEMQLFNRICVRIRERKGQSMTEYALIMAAIAVAAYAAYTALGTSIVNEIASVTKNL
jgi:Flp pilus assembly pilin Flp